MGDSLPGLFQRPSAATAGNAFTPRLSTVLGTQFAILGHRHDSPLKGNPNSEARKSGVLESGSFWFVDPGGEIARAGPLPHIHGRFGIILPMRSERQEFFSRPWVFHVKLFAQLDILASSPHTRACSLGLAHGCPTHLCASNSLQLTPPCCDHDALGVLGLGCTKAGPLSLFLDPGGFSGVARALFWGALTCHPPFPRRCSGVLSLGVLIGAPPRPGNS